MRHVVGHVMMETGNGLIEPTAWRNVSSCATARSVSERREPFRTRMVPKNTGFQLSLLKTLKAPRLNIFRLILRSHSTRSVINDPSGCIQGRLVWCFPLDPCGSSECLEHVRSLFANVTFKKAASVSDPIQRFSIRSPKADSQSRPTGRSSDTGSREMAFSSSILCSVAFRRLPISSFGWASTELLFQLAHGPDELVQALVHMDRDSDRAGFVGEASGRYRLSLP
jgi:hypothetical protein